MRDLGALTYGVITVRGDERLSYLQGQLTQDLSEISRTTSLLLAPSGEVLTDVAVNVEPEVVQLVVPTELAELALARLRRFVLRTKVEFELVGDAAPPVTVKEMLNIPWPSAAEWEKGLPPHSFGRNVVDAAISFTKGCFTGQELVGRADARGATMPWRFVTGRGGEAEAVEGLLLTAGPDGPKGLTSGITVEGELHWRGIAHRSFDATLAHEVGAELVFMA